MSSNGSCKLTVTTQVTVGWQLLHNIVTCWACRCVHCMPIVLREFTLSTTSSLAPLVISFLTTFKWPSLAASIRAVCPVCCIDRHQLDTSLVLKYVCIMDLHSAFKHMYTATTMLQLHFTSTYTNISHDIGNSCHSYPNFATGWYTGQVSCSLLTHHRFDSINMGIIREIPDMLIQAVSKYVWPQHAHS